MPKRPTIRCTVCFCAPDNAARQGFQGALRRFVCARQSERKKGRALRAGTQLRLLWAQALQNHAIRHGLPYPKRPRRLTIHRDQGAALARGTGHHTPKLKARGLGDADLGQGRLHPPGPGQMGRK